MRGESEGREGEGGRGCVREDVKEDDHIPN